MTDESDYMMTIGGKPVGGHATIPVIDPATGATFATAPDCTPEQLDDAVAAAKAAFPSWRATPDRRAAGNGRPRRRLADGAIR